MFAPRPSAALAALLLLLASATPLRADSQGGSFRLWPHAARDLAMGDAATLLAPGLESLFTQPASLVGMDSWELGLSAQRPAGLDGLDLNSAALGLASGRRLRSAGECTPTSRHAAALAVQHLGATLADDSGWGETTVALGLAWSPARWISMGLRGDYSRGGSDDGVDDGRAVAMSVGLRAVVLSPGLEFGWVAEDVVQRFHWQDAPDDTRRRASAQVLALAARLPWRLDVEVQGRWRYRSLERAGLGLEWHPLGPAFALRGGFLAHRRLEQSVAPSFGAGLTRGPLRVDYGFRFEREEGPGSQHRLSLRWVGGRP